MKTCVLCKKVVNAKWGDFAPSDGDGYFHASCAGKRLRDNKEEIERLKADNDAMHTAIKENCKNQCGMNGIDCSGCSFRYFWKEDER